MNAILKKLTLLLESNDIELRISAIRVITEIGFASRHVVQALGRCLREPHDELRLVALKGLARLGASDVAQMVVPLILSSGPLREQAMAVISAVGPSVLPQLRVLYPEADFHGKKAVITALSRIGGKPALAFLLKILPAEPFELQKHLALCICEALDRMSPAAQAPIYSTVLRLLRTKDADKNPQILVTGAILLGHFRGTSLAARSRHELRALAERKHPPEVRRHALVSFNRLVGEGKLSASEEQFLWKALTDEDWHNVAQHALAGFQRLEVPKKALSKLVDLLHHSPHFSVHIHIFERLEASDRPEVAEAILPFLADGRFRVREAAEAALRKMPTSIDSLFALLMKTEDLEVTQRINAILRDFPQETRQKYVQRAASRLLSLFEESDPHYKSFLEFVKSLDPEPLRKRIYEKALALKRGKHRDKWERMAALLQLLWDNHLITAEGRYLLAVALVRSSPQDLAPAARRANLGLRVLRALIYDDCEDLTKRLIADRDLTGEDFFYLGFHFSEEGDDMRPFSSAMLEHVVKKYPKAKVAGPAAQKLQLQAKAMEAAREVAAAEAEVARKKELKKQRKAEKEARLAMGGRAHPAGARAPLPAAAAPGPAAAAAAAAASEVSRLKKAEHARLAHRPGVLRAPDGRLAEKRGKTVTDASPSRSGRPDGPSRPVAFREKKGGGAARTAAKRAVKAMARKRASKPASRGGRKGSASKAARKKP